MASRHAHLRDFRDPGIDFPGPGFILYLMTTTNNSKRVTVYGKLGTVVYHRHGWIGVRLDGETRVDEWQPSQVKRV